MSALVCRFLDFLIAVSALLLVSPLMVVVFMAGWFDTGSPLFTQKRVGKGQKAFSLIKFRTMKLDTRSVATHEVSADSVTRFGRFLRKTKIDELPQLVNVLKGDMSIVGPRPCLFNQDVLIQERGKRNVFDVLPGITGLSQINEIDMSTPELLAKSDQNMIQSYGVALYLKIVVRTILGHGSGDRLKL